MTTEANVITAPGDRYTGSSQKLAAFAKAMVKVQQKLEHVAKDSDNPFYNSKYSSIAETWDTIRDVLTENGFSIVQLPFSHEGSAGVRTVLLHESGEYMQTDLLLPMGKANPQEFGKGISYARRYALSAVVGTSSVEDDDGNEASGIRQHKPAAPTTAQRKADMLKYFKEKGVTEQQVFAYLNVKGIPDIGPEQLATLRAVVTSAGGDDASLLEAFKRQAKPPSPVSSKKQANGTGKKKGKAKVNGGSSSDWRAHEITDGEYAGSSIGDIYDESGIEKIEELLSHDLPSVDLQALAAVLVEDSGLPVEGVTVEQKD